MSKPKLLKLTKIGKAVNEKGRQKIDMILDKEKGINSSSGELPRSWYTDQNLIPPVGLEDTDDEIDEEGYINLSEEEMEDTYSRVILNYEDFGMVVDGDEYSTVYTKSGMFVEIYESAKEVNKQIKKLFRD